MFVNNNSKVQRHYKIDNLQTSEIHLCICKVEELRIKSLVNSFSLNYKAHNNIKVIESDDKNKL